MQDRKSPEITRHCGMWSLTKMSHNLGLFMLTPGFCLQPANKNINFQLIMNSQKKIVTVAFKKIFLTKIEDMHTEFILRSCIQEW